METYMTNALVDNITNMPHLYLQCKIYTVEQSHKEV